MVAGERRVRASKLAGLDKIPAIVKDFSDDMMREIALLENLQRENLTAIELAWAYKGIIDSLHITQDELANKLGKSRSNVTNVLGLLRLPTSVQEMVLTGKLSMGHARELSKLEDTAEIKKYANMVVEKGLSVRELEKLMSFEEIKKANPIKKIKENNEHLSNYALQTKNENDFVYCLFNINIDKYNFFQFGNEIKDKLPKEYDKALIITNPEEFFKRLIKKAKDDGIELHHGCVNYYDEEDDLRRLYSLLSNGTKNVAFHKRKQYAYQQEYRFVSPNPEKPLIQYDLR